MWLCELSLRAGKTSYRCHLIDKTVAHQRLCRGAAEEGGSATVISSGTYLEREICQAYPPTLGSDCLQTFDLLGVRSPSALAGGRTAFVGWDKESGNR